MKTIKAYEYADLSRDVQAAVHDKELEHEIEFQLHMLNNSLENGQINEEEYWKEIGCSKSYGESTPWFIPSVYWEHHMEPIEANVREQVNQMLYNVNGSIIGNLNEAV